MKQKLKEWLRRYLPAELLSVGATLAGAALVGPGPEHRLSAALAATWAGNVAYFGYLLAADVRLARRQRRAAGRPYTLATLGRNVRALAVEFGVAELADSLLIRPALLYYLPLWLGHFAAGVVVAKLLADITFYVPAILSYELSKKHLRKF